MSKSDTLSHGLNRSYLGGCRCDACRKAHREYEAARREARKAPDSGLVDADRARIHLLSLSEKGLGVMAVHIATDISPAVIIAVRNGERQQIQKRTESRLLAVTPDLALDHALVDATDTWREISELLSRGTPPSVIRGAVGHKGALSRFRPDRVTVRTAARVRRLHQRLMASAADAEQCTQGGVPNG